MSQKATETAAVEKVAERKKAAVGYKLPDSIPIGEILRDVTDKKWQIGPSLGVGGFGEIYAGRFISAYIILLD
jgi:hypothetical protein